MDFRILFLQEFCGACNRSARSTSANKGRKLAVCITPDFGPGGQIVRLRIFFIVVLLRQERIRCLAVQAFGCFVIGTGIFGLNIRWTNDALHAVCFQQPDFFHGHLVRHDSNHFESVNIGHHRKPEARVPGSWLNNGTAGLEDSTLDRIPNHMQSDPVFYGTARIR